MLGSCAALASFPAPGEPGHPLERSFEATSEDLLPDAKGNCQIFGPLDFLARVTQHIPELGEHLIRHYVRRVDDARALASRASERVTVLPRRVA